MNLERKSPEWLIGWLGHHCLNILGLKIKSELNCCVRVFYGLHYWQMMDDVLNM